MSRALKMWSSREAAKECSPLRKLWVRGQKKGVSPEGAKEYLRRGIQAHP